MLRFSTDIGNLSPKGLNEDVIKSAFQILKKNLNGC